MPFFLAAHAVHFAFPACKSVFMRTVFHVQFHALQSVRSGITRFAGASHDKELIA